MFHFFIFFAVLLLQCIALKADEPIIVGTNAEFPPFTYIANGEIQGFDIDVAQEVCKRINRKMKIKDMPFDALLTELALGQVHILAAGMSYTDERAKRALFTTPYLTDDPLVIVSYNKELSMQELQGKTVVVNEGYTADLFLSKKEGIHLIRLSSPSDAIIALKSGRVDAYVTSKTNLQTFLGNKNTAGFIWKPIEGTAEDCSLVLSKKYPQLLDPIEKALEEMQRDGTIDGIKSKWKLL